MISLSFSAILFLLLLPLFILLLIAHQNNKNVKPSPPGPSGIPIIGNLFQLDFPRLHEHLCELSKQHGPLMSIKLGSVHALVVSSEKLAEEVLNKQDLIFCSRPKLVGQQKLSYNGSDMAFAPYGDDWRQKRKICIIHLFSMKRIRHFGPVRTDEVSAMITRIRRNAESSSSPNTLVTATNLSETITGVTSRMIFRMAFGKRVDDYGNVSGTGRQEMTKFDSLMHEMQALLLGFFFSDYFPFIGWMDKLTGMESRLETLYKKLDSFYQQLIDEHLDPNRPKSMDNDIIDLLLQLQRQNTTTSFHITLDDIKALLMNVFLGATDTSAIVVVWAMTRLIKNPDIMKKLQAEIRQLPNGEKEILTLDDMDKLPYLKVTVKETMRLHPTLPLLIPRQTREKCNIGGFEIPSKTLVYVNAWAIARDPETWENPDEFYPERFMDSDVDFKGNCFSLIPFGSGRRTCPASSMGLLNVYVILANLLRFFDWGLPLGMDINDIDLDARHGLALSKKHALKLVPKIPVKSLP